MHFQDVDAVEGEARGPVVGKWCIGLGLRLRGGVGSIVRRLVARAVFELRSLELIDGLEDFQGLAGVEALVAMEVTVDRFDFAP